MNKPYPKTVAAFSLVEVTLALGICAFCLLAIFGLLPVGLKSSRKSAEQTAAVGLLSIVAADLRAAAGSGTSAFFQIALPPTPVTASPSPTVLFFNESAQSFTELEAECRYRLTVKFLPNRVLNGGCAKMATLADVHVTWPAEVEPAAAVEGVRLLVAVDHN